MEKRLDYSQIRRYWDVAAASAAAASYMAHEQGLPQSCVDYRFKREHAVVNRWFRGLAPDSAILDIGCGGGAWSALFAQRFRRVVGIELSADMMAVAHARLGQLRNVELIQGDARLVIPDGKFDGAFVGGLLMYLDRDDAVQLLQSVRERVRHGPIILRESTVRQGVEVLTGDYQVVYRSPAEYRAIAREAGLRVRSVVRNEGYGRMEIAVELVNLVRRIPPLRRREPSVVGRPVWRVLELTAPLTLGAIPKGIESLGIGWPHLTNHFFLVGGDDAGSL